jgi:hypothetical protein
LTFAASDNSRPGIYLSRLAWCVTPIQTAGIRGLFPSWADGELPPKLQKGHGTDTSVLPFVRRRTVPGRADQNAFVRRL